MEIQTMQRDHWILDSEFSNISEPLDYEEIFMDAINKKVEDRKLKLEEAKTKEVKYQNIAEFQELPTKNTIPKFNYLDFFGKTQQWIGIVERIQQKSFIARLEDKNCPETYEIATFEISEVSKSDRELLCLGAIFYWSVGYAVNNGQVIKQSLLRFKRSVSFTEEEVNFISDKANIRENEIKWE